MPPTAFVFSLFLGSLFFSSLTLFFSSLRWKENLGTRSLFSAFRAAKPRQSDGLESEMFGFYFQLYHELTSWLEASHLPSQTLHFSMWKERKLSLVVSVFSRSLSLLFHSESVASKGSFWSSNSVVCQHRLVQQLSGSVWCATASLASNMQSLETGPARGHVFSGRLHHIPHRCPRYRHPHAWGNALSSLGDSLCLLNQRLGLLWSCYFLL